MLRTLDDGFPQPAPTSFAVSGRAVVAGRRAVALAGGQCAAAAKVVHRPTLGVLVGTASTADDGRAMTMILGRSSQMFAQDQGATASYRILARGHGSRWARTYKASQQHRALRDRELARPCPHCATDGGQMQSERDRQSR